MGAIPIPKGVQPIEASHSRTGRKSGLFQMSPRVSRDAPHSKLHWLLADDLGRIQPVKSHPAEGIHVVKTWPIPIHTTQVVSAQRRLRRDSFEPRFGVPRHRLDWPR